MLNANIKVLVTSNVSIIPETVPFDNPLPPNIEESNFQITLVEKTSIATRLRHHVSSYIKLVTLNPRFPCMPAGANGSEGECYDESIFPLQHMSFIHS